MTDEELAEAEERLIALLAAESCDAETVPSLGHTECALVCEAAINIGEQLLAEVRRLNSLIEVLRAVYSNDVG